MTPSIFNQASHDAKAPFLVLGVPRSGTTFFANVLNGHPEVLCGAERFNGGKFAPENLTEHGFLNLDLERPVAARQLDLIKTKLKIPGLLMGEKFPRAYLHFNKTLPRFEAAGQRLKLFILMRDIQEVACSWYQRCAIVDKSWPRGMQGVFPFIEQFILAHQLSEIARPEDVALVSYAKVYHPDTDQDIWDMITRHLELDDSAPFLKIVRDGAKRTKTSRDRDRSQDQITFTSDDPFYADLLAPVDQAGVCTLAGVQGHIRNLVRDVLTQKDLLDSFVSHLSSERNPDIVAYQESIGRVYKAALTQLNPELGEQLMLAANYQRNANQNN